MQTWIQPPNEPLTRIMPHNVGTAPYNGAYFEVEGDEGDPLLLASDDPGFHYVYQFQSRGPGQYSVHLIATEDVPSTIALVTELISESPVAATLIAVTPEVAQYQTAVLSAAVFEGANPVPNANVALTIISPSQVVSTLTLYDSGETTRGDHLPNDGLYSGVFVPNEVGDYTIHAKITGYRSGTPSIYFERDAGATVHAVAPCMALTGPLADYGQDDNENGLYEWLVIEAEVSVAATGNWILQAFLETPTGKTLTAYGTGSATAIGVQEFQARVASDAIHAAGDPGPYTIVGVALSCDTAEGAIPASRLLPNTSTHSYTLDQFEPPPEPDCNANGIGDVTELLYGLGEDCNHNAIPDDCGDPVPAAVNFDPDDPEHPTAVRSRSLGFSISPPSLIGGSASTAIRITPVDLQNPNPPNPVCCPPYDYSTFEFATCTAVGEAVPPAAGGGGCARWVGPPASFLEAIDAPTGGTYKAARLQCTPYYTNFSAEGEFSVIGAEIMPSSVYQVEVFDGSCEGSESTCTLVSCPATMTTRRAGDVALNFNPPSTTTQPDSGDVTAAVNKFKGLSGIKPVIQVQANLPDANSDVNALDIGIIVDNFKGFRYPFPGPCVCPSTVPCNTTTCATAAACTELYGLGTTCMKTCTSGPRTGLACGTNKHCGTCDASSGVATGAQCDGDWHCNGGVCITGTCNAQAFCRDRCGRCRN